MSANTCGTCKHWTEYTGYVEPVALRWGADVPDEEEETEKARIAAFYRLCQGVEENPERMWGETDPLPLAATRDGSNYMANLFTQAEFGCVLHESWLVGR